ncbi:hypothetical protein RND81_04G171500 [Saponaria officinalis]|uniref:Ubiquitin-like protease family profile domain-containing protein n=1 Tax=Saponaria officinalis TaxID=3572 RepID=A0AAW1LIK7_SAPOF
MVLMSELHEGMFSKHRTCWRHLAAHKQGDQGKMTEAEMKEIRWKFGPCFSQFIVCRKRSKFRNEKLALPRWKMSDTIFNNHLENIWRSVSEDKKALFTRVDSLCFYLYQMKGPLALKQIKGKDIFSKKYVIVPIVCWDHWRLVIFCHFGEDAYSKSRTRCILLLDSAESCAQVIGADVRKFVFDIFKEEGRPESKDVIYRIPFLVPKVPQQTNAVDCGRFVLYFIKMFIETAPRNFSMADGYPHFLKPGWFDPKSFGKFCDKLERELPTHKQGTCAPKRVSQRIRNTRTSTRKPSEQRVEVMMLED